MACKDCGPKTVGQCDACKLVDGDVRFKPVFHCATCGAYLCEACNGDFIKRAKAAILDKAAKIEQYFDKKFGKKEEPVAQDSFAGLKIKYDQLIEEHNKCEDSEVREELSLQIRSVVDEMKVIEESLGQKSTPRGDYQPKNNSNENLT